jgi:hypothetical protein
MQGKPFALVGVNSDALPRAKKAVETNQLNWRSFQNETEGRPKISDQWEIEGWPTLVVLDQDLRIRYRGHSGDEASALAKELVAELAMAGTRDGRE